MSSWFIVQWTLAIISFLYIYLHLSEHVQRNILENKMKLHKASKCDTVESKKLSIQHICQALGSYYTCILYCIQGRLV